jgi:predicted Zn-dependent protease
MPRPTPARRRRHPPSSVDPSDSPPANPLAGAALNSTDKAHAARASQRLRLAVLLVLALVAIGGAAWYSVTAQAHAARARILDDAQRDSAAAEKTLAAFAQEHPDDAEAYETLVAWHLRAESPLADFEIHLNRLCELRPQDADPLRTRAILRARDGRPEEAVVDGLQALELLPSDTTTRRIVATAAADAGQYDVAIREAQRLVDERSPPAAEHAVLLVKAYLQAGDAAGAEKALTAHFPAEVASSDRDALRAQVLQAGKKHVEAVTLLRALAKQSREYREFALTRLAQSLAALGRADEGKQALAELEAVKSRSRVVLDANQRPDDQAAQWKAGQVLIEDGEYAKAIALLEAASQRHGVNAVGARLLARAYRGLGREAAALDWERTAKQHE